MGNYRCTLFVYVTTACVQCYYLCLIVVSYIYVDCLHQIAQLEKVIAVYHEYGQVQSLAVKVNFGNYRRCRFHFAITFCHCAADLHIGFGACERYRFCVAVVADFKLLCCAVERCGEVINLK